jgi:ectoine hydroxylase-related dioxygenase (phytanoyl-CoA dioxygenase family)
VPERDDFERDGFVVLRAFAPEVCDAMLARVVTLARRAAAGEDIAPAFVMPESNLRGAAGAPEELVSKIFRLHRDQVFRDFASRADLVEHVRALLGTDDVDCFLSQFIFKNPGAWGQPCHQDSWYFPFDPPQERSGGPPAEGVPTERGRDPSRCPVVGAWLAVTEATLENGCLHVVAGSHHEPVHDHVDDRRPHANYGYVEIVDHDLSAAAPVLLQPGDLLLFDSHLMHYSTDNVSGGVRAAMVYHYARRGTHDRTEELRGYTINDWMPIS